MRLLLCCQVNSEEVSTRSTFEKLVLLLDLSLYHPLIGAYTDNSGDMMLPSCVLYLLL